MLFLTLFTFVFLFVFSQQKPNPIIFADGQAGFLIGGGSGFMLSTSVNYQTKGNLYSARYANFTVGNLAIVHPLIPIPYFNEESATDELGFLYGKRFIYNRSAFSFGAGVGVQFTKNYFLDANNTRFYTKSSQIGLPFQLGIHWFKAQKRRFRVFYGIIPVTKKTSFGRSYGFTLTGTAAKQSYFGLGFNLGLGYHKQYD